MSPAVPLFVLAFAGALIGLSLEVPLWAALVGASCCALVAVRARRQTRRALGLLLFTLLCALAAASFAKGCHDAIVRSLPHGEVVVLEGVASDIAPTRSGGWRVLLDVSGALVDDQPRALRARVQVSLTSSAAALDVHPGDRLRVRGRLWRLAPADTPGQFDPARFGLSRGLHGRLSVWDPSALVVMERAAELAPFAHARLALRERMLALVTPREAGVVLALLVGDTSLFDDEQLDLYRRVGAGHLLAVSGLQVTLLALLLQRGLLPLLLLIPVVARRAYGRALAALFALAGVWSFVLLCGAPPSAVRAAAMATAALVALSTSAPRVSGVNALAIAGLTTVLLSPVSVIDPSFLLSYAAVLGLLLAMPPKAEPSLLPAETEAPGFGGVRWRARRRQVSAGVCVTLGAGVLTLPISAHLFGTVAPGGVLANLVLVPAASFLQIPAMGLGLLGALVGSPLLATLGAGCAGMIEALCAALDGYVGGLVPLTAPGGVQTVGLTLAAALVVTAATRGRTRSLSRSLLCTSLALVVVTLAPALWPRAELRITALPVGQGDGAVFELPGGEVFVVDGGGSWDESTDPGGRVLLPYLARRGKERVDVVVLSHPHPDHLLGLLSLLEALPVGELWHPGYSDEHPLMRRLLEVAARRGVRTRAARELLGRHRFGDVLVDVIAPAPSDGSLYYGELHENDNSVVLRVRYGEDTALWTGDIEAWGERYLLEQQPELSADVVKAAHHGSRTSSLPEFVTAARAAHVLFSTGRDNQWGFPHAEVVARWRASGATIWDTARHGEITFHLTGEGVEVESYRDPPRREASLTPVRAADN